MTASISSSSSSSSSSRNNFIIISVATTVVGIVAWIVNSQRKIEVVERNVPSDSPISDKSEDDGGRIAINIATLPQPKNSKFVYSYYSYDDINNNDFFPVILPKNTPCRVLLSKGKGGKKTQLSPHSVITLEEEEEEESINSNNNDKNKNSVSLEKKTKSDESNTAKQDNNVPPRRVKVQYASGSIYNVRRSNLLPIIENKRIIVLVPETVDYRRLCIVHTRPQDGFIEIGSDLGKTIGQVVATTLLGIDKSSSSIETASRDYPSCPFLEKDVLIESKQWWEDLLRERGFNSKNLVVGLDINGNREYEAVHECLKRVLDWWQPRLVLVKSRSMFQVFSDSK